VVPSNGFQVRLIAWTELVGIDHIDTSGRTQPCVQVQIVFDLPFVLEISAKQPTGLGAGVENRETGIKWNAAGV